MSADKMVSMEAKDHEVWLRSSQILLVEPVGSFKFRVEIGSRRIESREYPTKVTRDNKILDLLRRMRA